MRHLNGSFCWFCFILFTGCVGCTQASGDGEATGTLRSSLRSSSARSAVVRSGATVGDVALKVVNWNTQTFFDSVKTGNEYSEFIKSSTWGREAYVERLKRLCATIKTLDADVFVMEELENEGELYDMSNFLAGEWDQRKLYAYGCYAKDEGSSIGCGVISRYPLSNMTVHSLDVRVGGEAMPAMRPLIEVTVTKGKNSLVLFVNHWKSKSGGTEQTEQWRNWQEKVLAERIETCVQENKAVLACGDFNRDIGAFQKDAAADAPYGEETILLRKRIASAGAAEEGADFVAVLSPWYDEKGALATPGSYFFDDAWERIDHFFIAGNAACLSFTPETNGPWCNEETLVPRKYELWNGYGYSDHLPVSCVVQF